jgi:hypothetical protein
VGLRQARQEPFALELRSPAKDLKATRRLVDFKETPEPLEEETPEAPRFREEERQPSSWEAPFIVP